MKKDILLIGDTVSACRVALSAMEPVLSHSGFTVSCLPTAIVSNTFGYKKVAQVSTGDYVAKSLAAWQEMGFVFDSIYVGYITDPGRAAAVADYCSLAAAKGTRIFHDPIMGEDGHLYYGMNSDTAALHKAIVPHTTHSVPSWTEAAFLTGRDFTQHPTEEQLWQTAADLQAMGAENVVITSCILDGADFTACLDAAGEKALLPCDHIPVKVAGTGDLFAAFYMARVLSGDAVAAAARKAMDSVRTLVQLSENDADTMRGVHLAQHLPEIK